MRRTRVFRVHGEDIEMDAASARKLVENLVFLTHGNSAALASYEALRQLLETKQLTACERNLITSLDTHAQSDAG